MSKADVFGMNDVIFFQVLRTRGPVTDPAKWPSEAKEIPANLGGSACCERWTSTDSGPDRRTRL